jgi:hypothetical protein
MIFREGDTGISLDAGLVKCVLQFDAENSSGKRVIRLMWSNKSGKRIITDYLGRHKGEKIVYVEPAVIT